MLFLLLHLCLFPFYFIVSDKSSPPQKTVIPMGKEIVIYLISISGCRQAQHIFFKAKIKHMELSYAKSIVLNQSISFQVRQRFLR